MTADQAIVRLLNAADDYGRDNREARSMCDALHRDLGLPADDAAAHKVLHECVIGATAVTMAAVGWEAHPEAVAYLLAIGRRMGMAEAPDVLRTPIELD